MFILHVHVHIQDIILHVIENEMMGIGCKQAHMDIYDNGGMGGFETKI